MRDCGDPVSRGRLWMPSLPLDDLAKMQLTEEKARSKLAECMSLLVGSQMTKLDSLLLHDRDPIVEKFNGQGQSAASAGVGPSSETYIASGGLLCDVPKQAKRRKLMRDSSWPTQHYSKHGAKWAEPMSPLVTETDKLIFPGLHRLREREVDLMSGCGAQPPHFAGCARWPMPGFGSEAHHPGPHSTCRAPGGGGWGGGHPKLGWA